MSQVRPFRVGDEAALAEICLRAADAGGDATGILSDDALWADVFVLPYVARHPDLAFVAEDDAGRVAGYIVGTDDTPAFERWFHDEWWPPLRAGRSGAGASERERWLLGYADRRDAGVEPLGETHPAHLHIDLLPTLQGRGMGRRLIDTFEGALRARGVTGLHLVAGAENTGALAFYDRLGFTRIPSPTGSQAFVREL